MNKLTEQEIEIILKNKINIEKITDGNTHVFYSDGCMGIGVSYEHFGFEPFCIGYEFCIIVNGRRINISGYFHDIFDAVISITEEWNNQISIFENQKSSDEFDVLSYFY